MPSPLSSSSSSSLHERNALVRASVNSSHLFALPSQLEVQLAMSEFLRYMRSACGSAFASMQQIIPLGRAHQAFHLLATNSTVQTIARSLVTDENVWTAVMNNPAVRNLVGSRETGTAMLVASEEQMTQNVRIVENDGKETRLPAQIWEHIMAAAKAIFKDLQDHFMASRRLPAGGTGPGNPVEELTEEEKDMLTVSFFVSIVLFLIVRIGRSVI